MPSKTRQLQDAASRGDYCKLELLLKRRAPGEKLGGEGGEALFSALSNLSFFKTKVVGGRIVRYRTVPVDAVVKTVRLLLKAGADPNFVHRDYGTVLSSAAGTGNLSAARMLLDAGADPNLHGDSGLTPLASAILSGRTGMVSFLLKNGANPRLKDAEGKSALDWARFASQRGSQYRAIFEAVKTACSRAPKPGAARPKAPKPAAAPGIKQFLTFIWDWGHPEWVLLAVEAPLDKVSRLYASSSRARKTWANVPVRPGLKPDEMAPLVALVQPKNCAWTVIYRAMCYPMGMEEFEGGRETAQLLSGKLKTRALAFIGEDTSGAMQYRLYKNGRQAAEKEWESQNDPADEVFEELGIFAPVCYPKRKGKETWLAVREPWVGRILRANLIEPGES